MSTLAKLQNWYESNCNGEWEHNFGVKIETLDNPGWSVEINLIGTKNENINFKNIKLERIRDDWVHCFVKDNVFLGAGGPNNLEEILKIFLDFVSNAPVTVDK